MDLGTLRVYAPTDVIFLCGGPSRIKDAPQHPESLRDAFQRVRFLGELQKYSVRLAEEILPFYPLARYRDLLSFESEIAQICELILLFSESEGSLCELGAFSMDNEIARKMLTVIQRQEYDQQSFVRLGPIQSQINKYGQRSIHVLNDKYLGIDRPNSISNVDLKRFEQAMATSIKARLSDGGGNRERGEHSTFDKNRPGHVIKLIVGIIQHYGSVAADEIDLVLDFLGIKLDQEIFTNYILCAKFVEWIDEDPVGGRILYSARSGRRAISFKFKAGFPIKSRDSWQIDVREHWKNTDPERFNLLCQAAA